MEQHDFNGSNIESLLLANDSTITNVQLSKEIYTATWKETFQRFYKAIVNNTVMEHLTIDLREIMHLSTDDGTGLLLQALEESTCIKTIELDKISHLHGKSRTFIYNLISTISRNKFIQSCQFYSAVLHARDLAILLHSSSLTLLTFLNTEVYFNESGESDYPSYNENIKDVGDAFEQNKTLRRLSFGWVPSAAINNRIILQLAQRNKSITEISIHFAQGVEFVQYDPQVLADVGMYLNTSERYLVFLNNMNWDDTTFSAFVSHINIHKNVSIKCLKFNKCTFDKNASILLKKFLLENQNLEGVSFGESMTGFHDEINVLGEIIATEKCPKMLLLNDYSGLSSDMNGLDSICTGLASTTSQLETLSLPCLSPTQLEYLLDKIPTFKNVIHLRFSLDSKSEHMKGKLISAFRNNKCLCQLKIDAPWLTDHDIHVLDRFGYRNLTLSALVMHILKGPKLAPSTIPSLFHLSAMTTLGIGPKDIVGMLSTLGDQVCDPNRENFLSLDECAVLLAPFWHV